MRYETYQIYLMSKESKSVFLKCSVSLHGLQLKSKVKEVLSNEMEKIKSGDKVDQSVDSC